MEEFMICALASIALGLVMALVASKQDKCSKGFLTALVLLPFTVQVVIMMVNGNVGTGLAVMGAFSLVRFRSAPGSAKENSTIFTAMAIGLATSGGYIGIAIVFTLMVSIVMVIFNKIPYGEKENLERSLKITMPEDLDYEEVFNQIFDDYTKKSKLVRIKSTNMGSLYELSYEIELKEDVHVKAMLDEIRCRNGNLNIVCGRLQTAVSDL